MYIMLNREFNRRSRFFDREFTISEVSHPKTESRDNDFAYRLPLLENTVLPRLWHDLD